MKTFYDDFGKCWAGVIEILGVDKQPLLPLALFQDQG